MTCSMGFFPLNSKGMFGSQKKVEWKEGIRKESEWKVKRFCNCSV